MFSRLKDLVFGLGEYDKTRFDVRFDLIFAMLPSLRLKKLENFELLEESISKLKELLRIKSSNLNKCIADSNKKLKKKDVVNLIEDLNKIKYEFLRRAFTLVEQDEVSRVNEIIDTENVLDDRDLFDNLVFENDSYSVRLSNGKVPYLFFSFKNDVDLNVLKEYEEVLYEDYDAHGSNVVVEGDKVLLIPRFNEDNLFELPKVQVDIDEIFEKLSKKNSEEILGESKPNSDDKVVEDDVVDQVLKGEIDEPVKEEYLEVSKKAFVKKKEDDSLDDLLSGDYKKNIVHPNPRDDVSMPEIIEGEGIEIIHKDPEVKQPEIEIIHKEEPKIPKEEIKSTDKFEHEVYRDDKVVIYLNTSSQVLGEICLTPANGSNMDELSETDLSYIMMFAKAFGGIVFESVEAHGTNLIFDYNNNIIRVVPRLQEDKLHNMNWNPIQLTEDELERMKDKLVEAMLGGAKPAQERPKEEVKEDEKIHEVKEEFPVEKIETDEDEARRKVEHLMEALHRIP